MYKSVGGATEARAYSGLRLNHERATHAQKKNCSFCGNGPSAFKLQGAGRKAPPPLAAENILENLWRNTGNLRLSTVIMQGQPFWDSGQRLPGCCIPSPTGEEADLPNQTIGAFNCTTISVHRSALPQAPNPPWLDQVHGVSIKTSSVYRTEIEEQPPDRELMHEKFENKTSIRVDNKELTQHIRKLHNLIIPNRYWIK